MYSQDFIDKVRDAVSIVEIISEYTELKKSGSGLLGLCPFPAHKEKTASFSVSDIKQAYYCFGCQRHGNVFTFLREMRGMSFPEAVEFLAERAHIPIPADSRRAGQSPTDPSKVFSRVNKLAADFYHRRLLTLDSKHPAHLYTLKRGLTKDIIQQFEIGFSGHTSELARHLQQQNVPMDIAEKLGLVKPSRDGNGYYDLLRDRLIFPIISANGQYIGFGGRVLDDSLPKYLNSPETPIFSKSKTLYGLNETAKFIRSEDTVLVVEGYMDFLGLYSAGIRNVAATLGTALTRDHAQILKRHTKNVIVLFDGDSAGQKASFRSLPVLLSEGLFPRAVSLPDGQDPDEFVKSEGRDKLMSLLKEAPELFFKLLESLLQKYGKQPSDKVHLINEAAPILKITAEPALKDLYLAELARRIDVQTQWLKKMLEGKGVTSEIPERTNSAKPLATQTRSDARNKPKNAKVYPKEERMLLNLALWKERYLKNLIQLEIQGLISNEVLRDVFSSVIEAYGHSPNDFVKLTAILFNKFEDLEVVTDHLNPRVFNFSDEDGDKLFRDCLIRIRDKAFKARARDLIQGLKREQDLTKLEQFVNEIRNRDANLQSDLKKSNL